MHIGGKKTMATTTETNMTETPDATIKRLAREVEALKKDNDKVSIQNATLTRRWMKLKDSLWESCSEAADSSIPNCVGDRKAPSLQQATFNVAILAGVLGTMQVIEDTEYEVEREIERRSYRGGSSF
jgi:hypothetical protein